MSYSVQEMLEITQPFILRVAKVFDVDPKLINYCNLTHNKMSQLMKQGYDLEKIIKLIEFNYEKILKLTNELKSPLFKKTFYSTYLDETIEFSDIEYEKMFKQRIGVFSVYWAAKVYDKFINA